MLHRSPSNSRRGFTLLEALMAATTLGVIVLAVASAISAAQKVGFEGQKRTLAAIAVNDLLSELSTLPYNQLPAKDGMLQPPGEMRSLDGAAYPRAFWAVGRSVTVRSETLTDPSLGVPVRGVRITVEARDDGAALARAELFVPEPRP
ncbi:MAG: prepilin-type N-terminal cleavage/methylation domain-containing protein [Phycisphaerales bacterium]|nr:prepilin-type N-terminal cleavage/methylation domain-containing protein [Phycisphaerales bacterium]